MLHRLGFTTLAMVLMMGSLSFAASDTIVLNAQETAKEFFQKLGSPEGRKKLYKHFPTLASLPIPNTPKKQIKTSDPRYHAGIANQWRWGSDSVWVVGEILEISPGHLVETQNNVFVRCHVEKTAAQGRYGKPGAFPDCRVVTLMWGEQTVRRVR